MAHSHLCNKCGNVFSHTRNPNWTAEQNEQAHMCPVCGSGPFYLQSNLQKPYIDVPPSAIIAAAVMYCMLKEMILECDEYYGNGYAI